MAETHSGLLHSEETEKGRTSMGRTMARTLQDAQRLKQIMIANGGPMRRAEIMASMGLEDSAKGNSEFYRLIEAIGASSPEHGMYIYQRTHEDEEFAYQTIRQMVGNSGPLILLLGAFRAGQSAGRGAEETSEHLTPADFHEEAVIWLQKQGFRPDRNDDLKAIFETAAALEFRRKRDPSAVIPWE